MEQPSDQLQRLYRAIIDDREGDGKRERGLRVRVTTEKETERERGG